MANKLYHAISSLLSLFSRLRGKMLVQKRTEPFIFVIQFFTQNLEKSEINEKIEWRTNLDRTTSKDTKDQKGS